MNSSQVIDAEPFVDQLVSEAADRLSRDADTAVRHVVWINQHAAFTGGVEQYIHGTTSLLREQGVRCTLLFDPNGAVSTQYFNAFDDTFPIVELTRQLDALSPDVAFAHRVAGVETIRELAASETPVIRFFHDHKLFCLREHKYTTLGCQTCTKTTGLGCYSCLGFVGRGENWPCLRLHSLSSLRREQTANQQLDAFAVGSRYMAEHVAAHGFGTERIYTLPLYAAHPSETPATEREADLLLFAGTLVRGKGVDTLLAALARSRSNARLVIAGDGRQAVAYQQLCKQLGLAGRVRFVGRLTSAELRDYLTRIHCLVMPSRSPETFGQSGLEALSHGAPVIGSDVGGMGEWLRHEQTGLAVPPNDEVALADAIDRMIGDPAFASRCGEQGRQLHLEKFTPKHHLEKLLSLFNTVIHS